MHDFDIHANDLSYMNFLTFKRNTFQNGFFFLLILGFVTFKRNKTVMLFLNQNKKLKLVIEDLKKKCNSLQESLKERERISDNITKEIKTLHENTFSNLKSITDIIPEGLIKKSLLTCKSNIDLVQNFLNMMNTGCEDIMKIDFEQNENTYKISQKYVSGICSFEQEASIENWSQKYWKSINTD